MSSLTTSRPSPRSSFEFPVHSPHSQMRHHSGTAPPTVQSPFFSSPSAVPTSPPLVTPQTGGLSSTQPNASSSSASYFNLVIDPNDPFHSSHAKTNWSPAGSSIRSAAAKSPRPVQLENFSKQFQLQAEALALRLIRPNVVGGGVSATSDHGYTSSDFSGDKTSSGVPSPASYSPTQPSSRETEVMEVSSTNIKLLRPPLAMDGFFSQQSSNMPPRLAIPTPPFLQLPLPIPSALQFKKAHARSSTLPVISQEGDPTLITPTRLSELLSLPGSDLLLIDVRTYKLYAESRIETAVNLCVPTTLLKRPSFNVTKLSETFAKDEDKEKFTKWKSTKYIIVYDADSKDVKDASAATHTVNKFLREGWNGQAYVLKGGFVTFSATFNEKIDRHQLPGAVTARTLSLGAPVTGGVDKVVGGAFNCPLPAQKSIVNPFFSNIRQNMDLIGGVGEMPVNIPRTMSKDDVALLPTWLKDIVSNERASKIVADKFLHIEQAERQRMQEAFNVSVTYDSPTSTKQKPYTLAGVELGNKNRYNNIWPYDHARVKLLDYPQDETDYVNASHLTAQNNSKRYIASQAPLPATFRDFWSMVWEQDVRVIVMLTAEKECGQVKSHNYWEAKKYGPLKLTHLSERRVALEPTPLKTSPKRRSVGTTPTSASSSPSLDSNVPFIVVRKFTLEHSSHPFSPLREITQLHYSSWPDFGAPAHPTHILGLIEHTDAVVKAAQSPYGTTFSSDTPVSHRPVLVHCSAGCGRTGAFCAVDTVIGMLRRQRMKRKRAHEDSIGSDGEGSLKMNRLGLDDNDSPNNWISRDDQDLIYNAVTEFREQRLSMVQSLAQYVLCYETVLEWFARQTPIDSGKRKA
ncbi:phosphotyrosine-specific ptp2-like protein [Rhizina undulata]